ncbi:MAG: hypothetical protein HYR98_08010 [Nitrospirae bacterium]|nr:hypothetical protein [Nitrospirota bacterium]MBI3393275.1 hypothetical protein [Nitrospirota bacterium]
MQITKSTLEVGESPPFKAGFFNDPRLSFAFCYLASHFGLGLLSVPEREAIMRYVEENEAELERPIEDATSP